MADVQSPLPIPSTSTTDELSTDEERARRRLVYDVVTQNLKALGAVSLEEYLASDSVGETSTPGASSSSSPLAITPSAIKTEDDDGEVVNLSRAAQDGTVNISVADDVPTEARPDSAVVSNSKYKFSDTGDEDEATHPCVFEMSEMIVVGSNGTVTPYWLAIKDPKNTGLWGCAFRVQVSDKEWRVWSVDTTYSDAAEAQIACCQLYQEDILGYLERTASCILPWATCYSSEPVPDALEEEPTWTVQQYFETLPRPFPEDVGDKTANEINAPSWFNSMLQISRGSRLVANFIWTESTTHGLHGCLLRLTAPGQCRSYLVASRFPKRAEAKAAVCLLAMSEGVGEFMRTLAKQVEDRLPPEVRKRVTSLYLPTLISECRKKRPEIEPVFEHVIEDECNGCSLTITLSNPANPESRTYTVPAEYRTRNDAKIAVVAQAVNQGVLDFIGFDSRALSPNRNAIASSSTPVGNKRKYEKPNDSRASTPGSTSDGRRKRRKYFTEGSSNQSPQPINHHSPQRSNHRRQSSSHSGYRQPWSGPTPPNHYSNIYPTQPHIQYQSPMSNVPPSYAPPYGYSTGTYPPNSNPYAMNAPSGSYYGAPPMPAQRNALPPPPSANPHPYQPAPATSVMQPYPNGMASQIPPRNPVYMHPPMPPNVGYPQPSNATYSQPFQPYPSMPYPYPQQYGYHGPTPGAVQPTAAIPYVNQSSTSTSSQTISSAQVSSQAVVKTPLPPKPSSATERKPVVKRVAPRPKPCKALGGKVTVAVEPTPQSSVTELYDYCRSSGLAVPEFRNEIVTESKGENRHKVWVMIGNKRLEVTTTFVSLSQGQERVARQALVQLQEGS